MPLKLEDKQAIVAQVAKIASSAHSVIAADYRGLSVADMTELREKARAADVYLRVVRNTLARRAISNTDFDCLGENLVGPIILAFSMNDPGSAARVIKDFIKTNKTLEVKAIALGGQLLNANDLDKVAKLPTYLEAVSMLMSVMLAPITQLVRTIKEPQAKLVRTVAAVRDNKS